MNATLERSNAGGKQIENFAYRVGNIFHIYTPEGRADVNRLAKGLGATIGSEYYRDDNERLMAVYGKGDFRIELPTHTMTGNDRFFTAKAVGHYLLHYYARLDGDRMPQTYFTRGEEGSTGDEAHYFAHALLMPEEHFRAAAEDDPTARSMSVVFAVGETVARRRAEFFGLDLN